MDRERRENASVQPALLQRVAGHLSVHKDEAEPVLDGGTKTVLYAHSLEGRPPEDWEPLLDHLENVARLCARFAGKFSAAGLGELAGRWHDLGKAAGDWQAFLLAAGEDASEIGDDGNATQGARRRGPDHSSAGAILARESLGAGARASVALQFAIAGHHAGLADKVALDGRLQDPEKRARHRLTEGFRLSALEDADPPELPPFLAASDRRELVSRRFECFVRMLFSALVDADRLATESAIENGRPDRSAIRSTWRSVREYVAPLEAYLRGFDTAPNTPVNRARRRVLDWCRAAAQWDPGTFTLTVPTGGGKTLSSLSFALRHAERWGLERVIVALPFLSILDQTADVYRHVFSSFGDRALVEHHSNLRPDRDTLANALASENWDAPLVVTTQVQLFESLFSNRPRDCRKLHNLCRSVLILDEVQTLPAGVLSPVLDQLRQLCTHYGVTLLLTTATQPALHERMLGPRRFPGFEPAPREIVPAGDMGDLFEALKRVEVHWPTGDAPVHFPDLAVEILREPQVLAIVHSRRDAVEVWKQCEALAPDAVVHLSASMCPAHRRKTLGAIKGALAAEKACRVVATQLVEAGVDLDFGVVYRAMGGLESLAQAAGRCDREGRRTQAGRKGQFHVFRAPSLPPPALRHHAEIAEVMLRLEPGLDLFDPAILRRYFDRLYSHGSLDEHAVQPLREALRFASTAEAFRMIDDAGATVVVPYDEAGRTAIEELRRWGPSRERLRALQSFGVALPRGSLARLLREGAVRMLHDTVPVLESDIHYHESLGLMVEPEVSQELLV